MLTVNNLNFLEVLKDINLEIKSEKITGIIGLNGSGKSCLMKCMLDVISNYTGDIKYFDLDVCNNKVFINDVGYVSQLNVMIEYLSVYEYLLLNKFNKKIDINYVDEVIDLCSLNDIKHTKIKYLSGGQRQRVLIAFSLIKKPKLLLLDEPLTYLDMYTQHKILKMLQKINKKYKLSVVIIHHDIEQVLNYCDELVILKNGRIKLVSPICLKCPFNKVIECMNLDATIHTHEDSYYIKYKY